MKKKVNRIVSLVLVASMCITGNAFSDRISQARNVVSGKATVRKIKLNYSRYTLAKGKKLALKAKITPKKASKSSITWKSSKKTVASVSKKGVVTGKKVGTAKITAAVKGTRKKAVCMVKVVSRKANATTQTQTTAKPVQSAGVQAQQPVQIPATNIPNVQTTETPVTQVSAQPEDNTTVQPDVNTTVKPENTVTPSSSSTSKPSVTATVTPVSSPMSGASASPTASPKATSAVITENVTVVTTPVPVATPTPVNDIDASVTNADLLPIQIQYANEYYVVPDQMSLSSNKSIVITFANTSQSKFFERQLSYNASDSNVKCTGMYQAASYQVRKSGNDYVLDIYTISEGLRVSYPIVIQSTRTADCSWIPDISWILYKTNTVAECAQMIKVGDEDKFFIGVSPEYMKAGIESTVHISSVLTSDSYEYGTEDSNGVHYITVKTLSTNVVQKYPVVCGSIDRGGFTVAESGNATSVEDTMLTVYSTDYYQKVYSSIIYGENESLGSAAVFAAENSGSTVTYTKFKHKNVYDGVVKLTYGHQTAYFYCKYIQKSRAVTVTAIQGKTNLITGVGSIESSGKTICTVGGYLDALGDDNVFTYNDGLISPTFVSLEAVSGHADYNYELKVIYKEEEQTVYIRYTKSTHRFLPSGFKYNGSAKYDQELVLITSGSTQKIRIASTYNETTFEENNYWSKLTWNAPYVDASGNPINYAKYKLTTVSGKHYLELWQKDGSYKVKSYEIFYEQLKMPEAADFTRLEEESTTTEANTSGSDTSKDESTDMSKEENIVIKKITSYKEGYDYVKFEIIISGPDATPEKIQLSADEKRRWDSLEYVALTGDAQYTGYFIMKYKTQTRKVYVTYTQTK